MGGQSLVNRSLIKRVERLKRNISISCKPNSKESRCLAREQIKTGKGMDSSLALTMFTNDLLKTYPSNRSSRRREVAYYVKGIISSNQQVFNYDAGSKTTNSMLNLYTKAQPNLNENEKKYFKKKFLIYALNSNSTKYLKRRLVLQIIHSF